MHATLCMAMLAVCLVAMQCAATEPVREPEPVPKADPPGDVTTAPGTSGGAVSGISDPEAGAGRGENSRGSARREEGKTEGEKVERVVKQGGPGPASPVAPEIPDDGGAPVDGDEVEAAEVEVEQVKEGDDGHKLSDPLGAGGGQGTGVGPGGLGTSSRPGTSPSPSGPPGSGVGVGAGGLGGSGGGGSSTGSSSSSSGSSSSSSGTGKSGGGGDTGTSRSSGHSVEGSSVTPASTTPSQPGTPDAQGVTQTRDANRDSTGSNALPPPPQNPSTSQKPAAKPANSQTTAHITSGGGQTPVRVPTGSPSTSSAAQPGQKRKAANPEEKEATVLQTLKFTTSTSAPAASLQTPVISTTESAKVESSAPPTHIPTLSKVIQSLDNKDGSIGSSLLIAFAALTIVVGIVVAPAS